MLITLECRLRAAAERMAGECLKNEGMHPVFATGARRPREACRGSNSRDL
jgi:hypothetical protein